MYPSTTTTAQTALPFNMEEFCKANERECRRLNIPIIDLNAGTPNTHKSSVFQCTSHIRARITPFTSLYILDFVDNNGSRIDRGTGLVVFDGQELGPDRFAMEPVWRDVTPNCELEIYFLHPAGSYEIRLCGAQRPLKTITFPSQVTTTVGVYNHSCNAMQVEVEQSRARF